jgi:D-glycero-D-manno-heptose 1,7-bisphosphate phosphatase
VKRAAVFLDRDGTLVDEVGYASRPEDIRLLPGAGEAVAALRSAGFLVVLLTNQSGVARGYFTEDDLHAMHCKLEKDLAKAGGALDGIYYCPHHPEGADGPYSVECRCRKPAAGMLTQAAVDLGIDTSRSYAVGDSVRDLFPGFSPLRGRVLVLTGNGRDALESPAAEDIRPFRTFDHLLMASDWIVERANRVKP